MCSATWHPWSIAHVFISYIILHLNIAPFLQGQGQTFQFPDLFPQKEGATQSGSFEELQSEFIENEKQRQRNDPRRGGLNDWFGL